jgi:hypothetical protein
VINIDTPKPIVESSCVVAVSFFDQDSPPSAVTPDSVTYTLTDTAGTVINSVLDTAITPGTTVNIVLSGNDLTLDEGVGKKRRLLVEYVYDSTYGNNLPGKEEIEFEIADVAYAV